MKFDPRLYMLYLERAKTIEEAFAMQWLHQYKTATKEQDMFEHWDVEGIFDLLDHNVYKFDVKGMKKINRKDKDPAEKATWVEGKNVRGAPGWIKGEADFIVFERLNTWVVVNRVELHQLVIRECKKKNYKEGKGIYEIYQRENRQDKLTLVPFSDIFALNQVWNLPKYTQNAHNRSVLHDRDVGKG